jgi:hypothetical protein
MKFYPQDWRADEKLRMCSLAARGLWMEMLAIMHRSDRYGQLLVGGNVPTPAQLAVQAGSSETEVEALLAELRNAGVFSVSGAGAIYSRRMIRDEKRAQNARKNGKSGGNPSLSKTKNNHASDKGEDNVQDKGEVKAQRPETRDQKEESYKPAIPISPERDSVPIGEFDQRCRALAQIINLTRPIAASDRAQLQAWIREGFHFEYHVIEGAKVVVAREEAKGGSVRSFKYLDGGIRDYRAEWLAERNRLNGAAA